MHIRSKHEDTKRANKEGPPKRAQNWSSNRVLETADQNDFKELKNRMGAFKEVTHCEIYIIQR